MYGGATSSSKKIAEYGGNTYGFGSRSVLGSGWPKDLVKVIYTYNRIIHMYLMERKRCA